MPNQVYDTIIIGAGPAALSAAVFTARANLKTLVLGNPRKSMLCSAVSLGNYLCTDKMSGQEWLDNALLQIKKYKANFNQDEVVNITKKDSLFTVKSASNETFESKTIIICAGVSIKQSGIKNQNRLIGKGIHTCVACDGYNYKNKRVAIIGNTNYAAEEAIELTSFTKDITIITNGKEPEISPKLKEVLRKSNAKYDKGRVMEFAGENKLEKIITNDGKELKFEGVFMALGTITALAFADKLALDTLENPSNNEKYLVIDKEGRTSLEGCYAAGACVGGNTQIAKSVGEGCNAAISVIKFVKGLDNYNDLT